ncbi:hypothetical protein C8R45DRAFT_1023477 [Mycena sanguinolenta]|nr:hypothetical protein C8R45DRAFT_1023477 [Mycena sanguinolenta]
MQFLAYALLIAHPITLGRQRHGNCKCGAIRSKGSHSCTGHLQKKYGELNTRQTILSAEVVADETGGEVGPSLIKRVMMPTMTMACAFVWIKIAMTRIQVEDKCYNTTFSTRAADGELCEDKNTAYLNLASLLQ